MLAYYLKLIKVSSSLLIHTFIYVSALNYDHAFRALTYIYYLILSMQIDLICMKIKVKISLNT